MSGKMNIFQKIDEFIFKYVDQLKNSPQYQQTLGQLDSLPDNQLKTVNQIISIITITLPLLICLILFIVRFSAIKSVDRHLDILNQIQELKAGKQLAKSLGIAMVSSTQISNKIDFERQIGLALSSNGITKVNLSVSNFEAQETGETIKSNATMVFKEFSTQNLVGFLEYLMNRQKMKIQLLETKLNEKESTLSGTINVLHFGKMVESK